MFVRLSVRLSVCFSDTGVHCDHSVHALLHGCNFMVGSVQKCASTVRYGVPRHFSKGHTGVPVLLQVRLLYISSLTNQYRKHSICKPNLVQIGAEVADIHLFMYFQDGGRPPSLICISPFWTTHDVPLDCCIFPINGVMIRSDVTEL